MAQLACEHDTQKPAHPMLKRSLSHTPNLLPLLGIEMSSVDKVSKMLRTQTGQFSIVSGR